MTQPIRTEDLGFAPPVSGRRGIAALAALAMAAALMLGTVAAAVTILTRNGDTPQVRLYATSLAASAHPG